MKSHIQFTLRGMLWATFWAAVTATAWNLHVPHNQPPPQVLEIRRAALDRAIEVDDMQRARALVDPALRGVERVVVVDRFAREVALHQADGLAAANVDGREEYHSASAVKLRSSRSPSGPDFSGWNCTP